MTPEFRAIPDISQEEIEFLEVPMTGKYVYGTYNDGYMLGPVIEATDEHINHEWWVKVHPETLEQYTGLKDKNGDKIFEGDIVSYNLVREYGANYDPITLGFMGNDHDIDTELIGKVVVWPSQGVMATNIRVTDPEQFDEKYPIPKRWHVNQQFEVIGNIHENLELLEVDK